MRLTEIVGNEDNGVAVPSQYAHLEINGLTCDSRQVESGYIFAALQGTQTDGRRFISTAIAKGASVILTEAGTVLPDGGNDDVWLLSHTNPRRLLAKYSANFYQKQPESIVAVTGTNGKTSVAYFCQQLWNLLDKKAASLGTIGISGLGDGIGEGLTTPDPVKLHETLAGLQEKDVEYLALEASSHGLDQCRLDGVRLKAAAFTNLSRDHLDYHHTEEAYFQAKARLFDEVMPEDGVAVLNSDIPEYNRLKTVCDTRNHTILSYGHAEDATFSIKETTPERLGQYVVFAYKEKTYTLTTPLIGAFQVSNMLCALGLVIGSGVDAEAAIAVLPKLQPAPGRMERVSGDDKPWSVYVDYAHTPDALEKALKELRPYASGKLHVIFGCGGDRDKGKRPQMGAVAARCADHAVVTDDNPRTENPEQIRAEILATCVGAENIADRKAAIAHGVGQLKEGDILLISGKGHEKTQKIGNKTTPFDDVVVAQQAMNLENT